MNEMEAIIREFLIESQEGLDQLDRDLVALEGNVLDKQKLAGIFRIVHSIKGTCGCLGFQKLESITHTSENLLSRLRDGNTVITADMTTVLLRMVDAVREILAAIENTGQEGGGDYASLVEILEELYQEMIAADATSDDDKKDDSKAIGELLVDTGHAKQEDINSALNKQHGGDPRHVGEILVEKGVIKSNDVVEALEAQKEQQERSGSISDSSIRVTVELLDKLMNQVGELVLVRNRILQFSSVQNDSALNAASQRLSLITTELQEGVMTTRLQPIGNIWNKFPRVVRDLSVSCGKQVELKMEGKDTELDKTLIEAIKNPLTHIVRNCVDHGLETPQERVARGKSAVGLLQLRAYHEGGQVNIEISDDGAGLNIERIKQKAIDKGLISSDRAARMSRREAENLVFMPGLSTSENVTNVSGRGVGMDVVKTNIEKIGGTVDIHSKLGEGTTLKVKIPLTLAIIPALLVSSGGDWYAIPQASLVELVRLDEEQDNSGIELIQDAPVYRLRGKLLPLVYLNRELKVDDKISEVAANDGVQESVSNIVVLQADSRQFGLVVDGISDTEEIVVKPLGKRLKRIQIYAGATIMGDGRVALILDVLGLAQRANVVSEVQEHKLAEESERPQQADDELETLLLFSCGDGNRMAIPLSVVDRLEKFPCIAVEHAGDQDVVQYRGKILPLVYTSTGLAEQQQRQPSGDTVLDDASVEDGVVNVVVCSDEGRTVGLVVDRILDIVEQHLKIKRDASKQGVLFSVVIQDRVTDMIDVRNMIMSTDSVSNTDGNAVVGA